MVSVKLIIIFACQLTTTSILCVIIKSSFHSPFAPPPVNDCTPHIKSSEMACLFNSFPIKGLSNLKIREEIFFSRHISFLCFIKKILLIIEFTVNNIIFMWAHSTFKRFLSLNVYRRKKKFYDVKQEQIYCFHPHEKQNFHII